MVGKVRNLHTLMNHAQTSYGFDTQVGVSTNSEESCSFSTDSEEIKPWDAPISNNVRTKMPLTIKVPCRTPFPFTSTEVGGSSLMA